MKKIILIKYGELFTKKGNRKAFINKLQSNICHKLKEMDVKVKNNRSFMQLEFNEKDLEEIKKRLSKIFGIHAYQVASVVNTNIKSIEEEIIRVSKEKEFKTFKVETKRSYKEFELNSMQLSKYLGGVILKNNKNIKVDVKMPDILFKVEVKKDNSYIYTDTYKGLGGYPVGSQPKGMLMLSGGIDSPVAGFLSLKRGIVIDAVYFEAIPHTSLEAREKVIKLAEKLVEYTNEIKLHIIPFTNIQEEIYKNCNPDYTITIMRRMMYRIMESLAKKNNAFVIINGESIGQVASQTLTSMSVINEVTNMPVIRPVACLDKLEIMDIAKKIDTYETSILPYEDCCTVFVPRHPVINPKLEIAKTEEEKFDYKTLINKAIEDSFIIEIKDKKEKKFEKLL